MDNYPTLFRYFGLIPLADTCTIGGGFEALAQAVDELEIPPYGDAVAEVIAIRDRLDAAIAEAVGHFDAEGGWQGEGATSMTAWLRHRCSQRPRRGPPGRHRPAAAPAPR